MTSDWSRAAFASCIASDSGPTDSKTAQVAAGIVAEIYPFGRVFMQSSQNLGTCIKFSPSTIVILVCLSTHGGRQRSPKPVVINSASISTSRLRWLFFHTLASLLEII